MKYFIIPFFLVSLEAFPRCASLPRPFKTAVKILHIENLSSTAKVTECGVELEIGSGELGWLKKGEKANFWSDTPRICNVAPGTVTTVTLMKDCCDANYAWCAKEWKSGDTTKTAHGNRIWNPKGNPTF